jgi:hypothetical protein
VVKARQYVIRALTAFGRFWWDFLIGDTPEFALATVVLVGLAYALRRHHLVATIVLPLLAATFLAASTYRGRRKPGAQPAQSDPAEPADPAG